MARKILARALIAFAGALLLSSAAYGQSAITGVVKDTTGAAMPGVTVEASSDVLIEKVRSVVTNESGMYQIVDLRPGTYVITYTLPGFTTLRRDGIVLPTSFTANINVELKVGELAETITVTGESPIVDVSTAVHTSVLDRETIDALPSGRTIQGMAQLIVGVNLSLPDTGGARAMAQTFMTTHGMSLANNTVLVDGLQVNGLQLDGGVQSYFNDAMNQEVSYQTAGIGADTSAGGVRLNMIPKEGGNRLSGSFTSAYRPGAWQSNNLTDRHKKAGLRSGNSTDRIIDYTASIGGPIKRDKMWFFGTARYISVNNFIPDTFFDDGSKGLDDQFIKSALLRLTYQASPRNKFSAYVDEVDKYRGHDMQSRYDPETAATVWRSPAYHTLGVKWTSTVSSKLLLEAGFSNNTENYTNEYREGIEKPRGTAEWFKNVARDENDLGGVKDAALFQTTQSPVSYTWNTAASYVTGSHNLKAGVQMRWGQFDHTVDANGDLVQQYRSASTGIPFTVPDTVLIRNTPLVYAERLNKDLGVYIQDSWRLSRLTINGGLRYELLQAQVLARKSPAGRFVPERNFAEIQNVPNWKDLAPRFAAVYDVFGSGKTALKYSLNRYNQSRTTGIAQNYNPALPASATLTWRDTNNDDIAQGERGCVYLTPGCEINFGTLSSNFGIAALNTYGEYPRTWNLESGVELQHQLLSGLSVTGSWFHGSFHNLQTTINRSLSADRDYTPITVYNPLTGNAITAYSQIANLTAPTSNLDTFDPEREQIYDSYNLEFRARLGRGAQLFGGTSIERELQVNCTAPDNANTRIFCNDKENGIPFKKNLKLSGTIPVGWGITVSGVLQSNESPNSTRTMVLTRTTRYPANCPSPCPAGQLIAPTLGQSSLTVAVEPARATFVERITQLDFKVSRTFKFGRATVLPTFEVFNVNNADTVITYVSTNTLAGAGYLRPNSILQGRLFGVGVQTRW